MAAAEKAGALGAFLSGSGSTIAAVTLESPKSVAPAMLAASAATARVPSSRPLTTLERGYLRNPTFDNRHSELATWVDA